MATTGRLLTLSLALLAACGGQSRNTAPRLSTIPAQQVTNGAALTLDVATYVTNQEGGALTYAVVSGGGAFTGSTYSGTFDTLGSYSVSFTVTDSLGKAATSSFTVAVTGANLAAFVESSTTTTDLRLLDTDTTKVLEVATSPSANESLATTLPQGQVVYTRTVGGQTDLYAYTTATRVTSTLGAHDTKSEAYRAKTSDGKVVFTVTSGADSDLYLWNSATGLVRTISNGAGQADENPFVTSTNLVYYERGVGGQRDIAYYDPSTDTSTDVSAAATDERIVAVLPNDAVLFTRIGGGGEKDLFYHKVGTGLVEVGSDLGATIGAQTKNYSGRTSDSRVVFSVSASSFDLYIWNPATGSSRTIGSSGVDEVLYAVSAADTVVYVVATSSTNWDVRSYSPSTDTSVAAASSADMEIPVGHRSNGDVVYTRAVAGGGTDLYHYSLSGAASAAIATAGTGDYSMWKVLPTGRVVYGYSSGGVYAGLFVYDPVGASSATIDAGNATYVALGLTSGDFVWELTASGNTNVNYYKVATTSSVAVAATTDVDRAIAVTAAGDVLWHQQVSSTRHDLFLWRLATSLSTQITSNDRQHGAAVVFAASTL